MRTSYCKKCDKTVRFYTDYGPKPDGWLYICSECDTELNNNFKLCILAAGRGTRNNDIDGLHKGLLPLENKPAISHIIDNVDKSVEIVIAVGYKSEQIKSYMKEVHSDRKIKYVDIDNYDGPGSGPGYSLLSCKNELQSSFIFTSVDTIVSGQTEADIFSFINYNWIGVSDVDVADSISYCLVKGDESLDNLYYGRGNRAYIGMAGISDYKEFWESLESAKNLKDKYNDDLHEYQVTHGFDGLGNIKLVDFNWHDTGTNQTYRKAKKFFSNDVVANKKDEAIFIDEGKVVKYFDNPTRAKTRIKRAEYLNGNAPKVKSLNDNMYSYDFVNGKLLSDVTDEKVLNKFLDFCKDKLWKENYTSYTNDGFVNDCKIMYEDKTKARLSVMEDSKLDKIVEINGIEVKPVKDLLDDIDWKKLYENAIPTAFHGDLQPENILYDENDDKFILIDWREGFGNSKEMGDIYYDLSKLYHALLINGNSVLKGMYNYRVNGDSSEVHFYAKSNLIYLMDFFKNWCNKNGYDWYNVKLLGILHYLNICTLYDNFQNGEYGKFLFLYGKYLLTKHLNNA